MDYRYIGCAEDGRIVKGTLAAASEEVAAKVLTSQSYEIFSLKPIPAFLPSRGQIWRTPLKVKPEVIIVFTRQLALLLESGTDIVTSLELLQAQSPSKYFKRVIEEITSNLRGGSKLSTALSKHAKVFSQVYIQSISVGEQSGGLETVLREIADFMEKEVNTAKGVKGALKYPIVVSVVAFIVISLLIFFVLPAFTDLYSSLGAELPPLTKMTLFAFEWLTAYGPYLMGAILLVAFLAYTYAKTPDGRLLRDRLVLKLPLMGRPNHLNELVRCCRSISMLYRAGLSVTGIMSLVVASSSNLVIKNALVQVQEDVLTGEGLSQSMAKSQYFLPMMVQMVALGEATGNLDVALLATADTYETEVKDRMRSIIELIQPAITLFIGIIVALIALSLVTAMYSIYGQIA